jgi:hypothetical protein
MPDLLAEITHAARAYYQQLQQISCTETDFRDWLQALPMAEGEEMAASGFAIACTRRAFQRHCLEWRGYSMREFMRAHLPVAAFDLWEAHREFNGDLPA